MANDTFDAVLAEGRNVIRDQCGDGLERAAFTDLLDRLAAAHAAEVAERDAARALDHAAMNALRDRAEAAERDAGEAMELLRKARPFVATCPDLYQLGGDELANDIDAAIATTEQAPERAGRE